MSATDRRQAPLAGRRVVVTRARAQASELVARLEALGAATVEVPSIEIVDPDDGGEALRRAAARVASYDWVVLTSPNGAERLLAALADPSALAATRVAAIGPGTADVLAARGVAVDVVPPRFVAESLVDALPPAPPGGGRVLVARAEVARDVLPAGLETKGWDVDVVVAYRTVTARPDPTRLELARTADAITFTSSSTVTSFLAVAGADAVPGVVACIGPITADTARRHGLAVTVEADRHTIPGLVDAVVSVLAR